MATPEALLLDAGGIVVLPDHRRIMGAFSRAGSPVPAARLDRAHYLAAAKFTTDLDAEGDWAGCWEQYLAAYVAACGVPGEARDEVHCHVDSEFADAALWTRVIPGCRDGLRAIAGTGVRLGVVSNADGVMGERLRHLEVLQVGAGLGVEVECVIDSGAVGVMKPDPRIFRLALEAMGVAAGRTWYVGDMPGIDVVGARRAGLRPLLMDPLGLHHGTGYERVGSLAELAARIGNGSPGRSATADGHGGQPFSLASAFGAAREDRLAHWVGDFLVSRGGNAPLAAALAQRPHFWLGPIRVPVGDLVRLAGPEDDALCPIEPDEWEDDVEAMADRLEEGWDPPPLLVEFQDGRLLLQDGNHRYEALVRQHASHAWVLMWFDDPHERRRFCESHPAAGGCRDVPAPAN